MEGRSSGKVENVINKLCSASMEGRSSGKVENVIKT